MYTGKLADLMVMRTGEVCQLFHNFQENPTAKKNPMQKSKTHRILLIECKVRFKTPYYIYFQVVMPLGERRIILRYKLESVHGCRISKLFTESRHRTLLLDYSPLPGLNRFTAVD